MFKKKCIFQGRSKKSCEFGLALFKAIAIQEVLEAIVGFEDSLYYQKYSELLEVVEKALYKEEKNEK